MTKISDHAIVRYLERVKGMDIGAIRKEILPENVAQASKALGNGYYPVGNSHKVRVKNGVVITVLKPKMKNHRYDPTACMTTRNKTIRKRDRRRMKQEANLVAEYEQYEDADLI